jgi:TPP-dependent pyruvate/acetoin dehydrogenase alpha subunit
MALGEVWKKSGVVTTLFIGDGTLGQGIIYEAFNMASLWSVPLLIVVENNQYAMSTPIADAVAGSIQSRARAFDIQATECDGNDVEAVFAAASGILDCIRTQSRPHMLVLNTYRLCGHSKSDEGIYRPAGELERWQEKDPLIRIRALLPGLVADALDRKALELVKSAETKAREAAYDRMEWCRP